MRSSQRFRVGFVSSSCLLFAFACGSESPPTQTATGGAATATGGAATATGGASTGGAAAATGGSTATGGAVAATGGASTGGASTGGASTGGASTGGASPGGSSTGGAAGGQGGATSMGGSAAGGGGKASAGAGGAQATGGAAAGAGGAAGAATGGSGGASGFTLTSPAWTTQPGCAPDNKAPCGIFPKANTNLNGEKSVSPELNWKGAPSGTQSYAIVLHDLSNIMQGNPFVHWVMWNIPASVNQLPAGLEKTAMPSVPAGSSQRAYTGNGYIGSGKCGNVYEFVLYALPTATFTPSGTTQTSAATSLRTSAAPTATLRARSGAPECTE